MTIQRWELRNGFRGEDAYKHEDGVYVLYTDHLAALTAAAEREAKLVEALTDIRLIMGGEEGGEGWESPEDVWGIADAALAPVKP